jgi:hypothetical protein
MEIMKMIVTEMDFYKVKTGIARGIYGHKAVTDAQFAKCHAAALNVFINLGSPAYQWDEWFMAEMRSFTYFDRGKRYTYRHAICTALDMFVVGFCDEVWCGPEIGLQHRKDGRYTLMIGATQTACLKKEAAVYMWLDAIAKDK